MAEVIPELNVVRISWELTKNPLRVPTRCVVCNSTTPDSSIEYRTWTGNRSGAGITANLTVPFRCCSQCKTQAQWGAALGTTITLVCSLPLLGLMYALFALAPTLPGWVRWIVFIVGLLVVAIVSNKLYAPPVSARAWNYAGLRYDFRHKEFAEEFRSLNGAT